MPFENFYREQDAADSRWLKCVGAAFLLLTGYLSIWFVALRDEEPSAVPSHPLTQEERFRRVEAVCDSLPRPEEFYFLQKKEFSDYETSHEAAVQVIHLYASARTPQEILPQFIFWFNEQSWQRHAESEAVFFRGNQKVIIHHRKGETANYQIACSETFR